MIPTPAKWPASSWLLPQLVEHSTFNRKGKWFESHTSLTFFRLSFCNWKSCVYQFALTSLSHSSNMIFTWSLFQSILQFCILIFPFYYYKSQNIPLTILILSSTLCAAAKQHCMLFTANKNRMSDCEFILEYDQLFIHCCKIKGKVKKAKKQVL